MTFFKIMLGMHGLQNVRNQTMLPQKTYKHVYTESFLKNVLLGLGGRIGLKTPVLFY